jgi:hypothetical protein
MLLLRTAIRFGAPLRTQTCESARRIFFKVRTLVKCDPPGVRLAVDRRWCDLNGLAIKPTTELEAARLAASRNNVSHRGRPCVTAAIGTARFLERWASGAARGTRHENRRSVTFVFGLQHRFGDRCCRPIARSMPNQVRLRGEFWAGYRQGLADAAGERLLPQMHAAYATCGANKPIGLRTPASG